MNPINDLMLQRLVDGELSHRQIQQILADAQASPEQWKEIACGFIEQQIWKHSFTNADIKGSPSTDNTSGQFEAPATSSASPIKPVKPTKPMMKRHDKSSNVQSKNFSWLLIAASFMFAATIGYSVGLFQTPNIANTDNENRLIVAQTDTTNAGQNNAPNNPAENNLTPVALKADYHVELPADNEILADWAPADSVSRVPLYQISNRQQLNRLHQKHRPTLSQDVIDQLSRSGYQLKQRVEFISGRLDDGRHFYVPVQTIKLLPGQ